MLKPSQLCIFLLFLSACDEPVVLCDDVALCTLPAVVFEPATVEFALSSAAEITVQNVGTGLLRIRDARFVADSGDGFVIEFAVVAFDSPIDDWAPINTGPIEVPRLHSVLWRITAQGAGDGMLVMRTNDESAPEISIPISAVQP